MPAILALVDGPFGGRAGLDTARAIARAFLEHWERHHTVLVIRNLAADRGDPRFAEVRRAALQPFLERLAVRIAEAQREGRVSRAMHPFAAAAALGSLLEALSAHTADLARRGIEREALIETSASIVNLVVTGASPTTR